jgi:hypothetical protein
MRAILGDRLQSGSAHPIGSEISTIQPNRRVPIVWAVELAALIECCLDIHSIWRIASPIRPCPLMTIACTIHLKSIRPARDVTKRIVDVVPVAKDIGMHPLMDHSVFVGVQVLEVG